MISAQLLQRIEGLDEVISEKDDDFKTSGLKVDSLIRICRLAVVDKEILIGAIGEISLTRLNRIRSRLADWLSGSET